MFRSLKRIADCLCELVDVEKERKDIEQQILDELKKMNGGGVAVRGVVTLGKPVEQ